jgi:hypothetical protein
MRHARIAISALKNFVFNALIFILSFGAVSEFALPMRRDCVFNRVPTAIREA